MDAINPTSGSGAYFSPTPITGTDAASSNPAIALAAASVSNAVTQTTPQNDSVKISEKGAKAAQYAQQARVIAPLDAATVKKLKAAIAEGKYPPPALVQGLVNLVGNNIASS